MKFKLSFLSPPPQISYSYQKWTKSSIVESESNPDSTAKAMYTNPTPVTRKKKQNSNPVQLRKKTLIFFHRIFYILLQLE